MLKSEKSRIKELALQLIEELCCCDNEEFINAVLYGVQKLKEDLIEEL